MLMPNLANLFNGRVLGSDEDKNFAVLGLDSNELEQGEAAEEVMTISGSDDEAPETVTKESARKHVKRLDFEAAKASNRYHCSKTATVRCI